MGLWNIFIDCSVCVFKGVFTPIMFTRSCFDIWSTVHSTTLSFNLSLKNLNTSYSYVFPQASLQYDHQPRFAEEPSLHHSPHFPSTHFAANERLSLPSVNILILTQNALHLGLLPIISHILSLITFTPKANRTMVRLFGPHQSTNVCSHLSKQTRLTEKMEHGPIETDQTG